MIHYEVATATNQGKVREGNEDFVRYPELDQGFAIALADGMARHAGGEVASRLAVDSLMASLPPDVLNLDEEPQLEALVGGLEAAHRCTDGVYVELSDERLAALACAPGSAQERVERLISAVLETPARDNATLALAVISQRIDNQQQ